MALTPIKLSEEWYRRAALDVKAGRRSISEMPVAARGRVDAMAASLRQEENRASKEATIGKKENASGE